MMNPYPDTRWCAMSFRFEFIDQEARGDATPTSSDEYGLSNLTQTVDGITDTLPYIALDHNRWGLGQDFVPVQGDTSQAELGWIAAPLSLSDGTFTTNPYLQFDFAEPHSSIGFTIHFEDGTGCHATEFQMEIYDELGNCIVSKTIENHRSTCVISALSPDYRRVRFTFLRLSRPLSRLRIAEVLFGIVEEYTPDTILDATLQYEVDPIAEALPTQMATLRMDNSNQRFNLVNPEGVYAYLQQPQAFQISLGIGDGPDNMQYSYMGTFYFATASAQDSGLTAEITAYDWFYWMEYSTYQSAETGTWTLQEAVVELLTTAGISCSIVIDATAASRVLRKVTDKLTHREALRLAVQAACCTAYWNRNGQLVVTPLTYISPVDFLIHDNMESPAKVAIESAVNTVCFTTHDDDSDADVTFTASNVPSGEMVQTKTITNAMVHPDNGQMVAEWVLSFLQNRLTYTTAERGNPAVNLGETVEISDYFGTEHDAIVIKQTYTYQGGLQAESVAMRHGTT